YPELVAQSQDLELKGDSGAEQRQNSRGECCEYKPGRESAKEGQLPLYQLDRDFREPQLLLHHQWGFSFEEIAGMLGISAAAARARASRGLADLRVALNSLQRARA